MEIAQTPGVTAQKKRTMTKKTQDYITIIIFLLPAFVLFLVFIVYPIIRSTYFSFFTWNGLNPAKVFVGIKNFQQILGDKIFLKAVENGLLIVALSLVIQLPLSLFLAILVGRDLPGRGFFRAIFFMPYVLSEVITAIIWLGLMNPDPDRGFINALLVLIPGLKPVIFLGNMKYALPSIFVVLTWKYFGLHMLLYLAGLQNIPREIEEAALIDGANQWQMVRHVTIPLLGQTIRTTIQLSVLGALTQFNLIWIMTKGGPVNASESMATYMYRFGFIRFWFGYGAAVALVLLLICLAFSIVYQRIYRIPDYLGGL